MSGTADGTPGLAGRRSRACDVSRSRSPSNCRDILGIAEANAMLLDVGRFAQSEIDGRGDAPHYRPADASERAHEDGDPCASFC
jgi:hypothetical protein